MYRISLIAVALTVGTIVAAPQGAEAGPRVSGENTAADQNLLLRAEWERARLIGGYEDPIAAFSNLLNGTPTKRTVQPRLTVSGNETIEEFRQQFRETVQPGK